MAFRWTFPNYCYYFFYKICFVMLSCCPIYICNVMNFSLLSIMLKVQTKLSLQSVCKAMKHSNPLQILVVITMPVCIGSSDTALRWSKVIVCKQQMNDFFYLPVIPLGHESHSLHCSSKSQSTSNLKSDKFGDPLGSYRCYKACWIHIKIKVLLCP